MVMETLSGQWVRCCTARRRPAMLCDSIWAGMIRDWHYRVNGQNYKLLCMWAPSIYIYETWPLSSIYGTGFLQLLSTLSYKWPQQVQTILIQCKRIASGTGEVHMYSVDVVSSTNQLGRIKYNWFTRSRGTINIISLTEALINNTRGGGLQG